MSALCKRQSRQSEMSQWERSGGEYGTSLGRERRHRPARTHQEDMMMSEIRDIQLPTSLRPPPVRRSAIMSTAQFPASSVTTATDRPARTYYQAMLRSEIRDTQLPIVHPPPTRHAAHASTARSPVANEITTSRRLPRTRQSDTIKSIRYTAPQSGGQSIKCTHASTADGDASTHSLMH